MKTKNKSSHKVISKDDAINIMQNYQRNNQNMFKNMPKNA